MRLNHRALRHKTVAGVVATCAALLCAVTLAPAPALAAATTAWRADGYGPQNGGFNPVETEINTSTVDELAYRWSIVSPVFRGSCSRQSPPVVANNRIFVTDQTGIAAYNAKTGKQLWTYRFRDSFDEVTPVLTVAGNRLLAAFNGCISQSDPDGQLVAFNVADGTQLWSKRRDAPMYVKVIDKDVAVVAGEDVFEPVVTGYRVSDGAELWSHIGRLHQPVSANGRVLVEQEDFTGSDLLDIRTGAVLWTSPTRWAVQAAGQAGGPLYATGPAGELARINVETGAVAWSVPGAGGKLAVDGPRLYVAQGTDLVARDSATGAVIWTTPYFSTLGKPVVAGGVVYATVDGRFMEPLNAATGAVLDDFTYQGVVGHPVIVNGWLYVTNGRVLDAFHL
jgi:outer membrane protein assembly factor BamB